MNAGKEGFGQPDGRKHVTTCPWPSQETFFNGIELYANLPLEELRPIRADLLRDFVQLFGEELRPARVDWLRGIVRFFRKNGRLECPEETQLRAIFDRWCPTRSERAWAISQMTRVLGEPMRPLVEELLKSEARVECCSGATALLYIDEQEGLKRIESLFRQYMKNPAEGMSAYPLHYFVEALEDHGGPGCEALLGKLRPFFVED